MAPSISLVVSALLSVVLAPSLAAQQTIVVQGGGPALQLAINAASPGDTLDVFPGTYDPIVVAKGIRIACRGGVLLDAGASGVPAADISGVPAGATFELEGGTFRASSWNAPALRVADTFGTVQLRGAIDVENNAALFGTSLLLQRCHGPVIVHAATLADFDVFDHATVSIRDSAQVAFTGSTINQTLYVTNSNVAFTDTDIAWGLRVESGSVSLADGDIHGPWQFSGIGYPAVILSAGELALAGSMTITATAWGQVSAVQTQGGLVRVGPGVSLRSSVGAPGISGPARVLNEHLPSVHTLGVPSGQPLTVRVDGEPSAMAAVFVDVCQPPVPTPFGPLWVSPLSPVLAHQQLDPNGALTVTVPAVVPPGTTLTLQAMSLSPGGALSVGTAARIAID